MQTPLPIASSDSADVSPTKASSKKIWITTLLLLGFVVSAFYVYDAWHHESTDDAYVTGHLHEVSSRISGVVTKVAVDDNQGVRAGDLLVGLDPADNQALYDEAKANYEQAKLDDQRNEDLMGTKAATQQDMDHAHAGLQVAQARLDTARLQLGYTSLVAPTDGRVGQKSVEVGNRVQPGQTLLVVVESEVWVVANFKETQLARLRSGQAVHMTIDAVPGHLFTGHIESVAPASGNEFALLPADNSTGNFTKIVQRFPVKIHFDPEILPLVRDRVRPGMSVVVRVEL